MPTDDSQNFRATERNALLRALPSSDYAWLAAHLDEVTTRAGDVLVERDVRPDHVHFPQSGVISMVTFFESGGSVEVGTIGCEGIVGLSPFLATASSPNRTITQIDAVVRRMPVEVLMEGLAEHPAVDRVLRRYTDAYIAQVSQNAACNRMHDIGERCARWLLMTHDRVGSDTFALTHEFLAVMLGVRRAGVSEAAAALQRAGAIRYSRGRVTVTDRAALDRASCECYAVIRRRFDVMLEEG